MSVYFLPALASLLFKLFVLLTTFKGGRVSIVFLSLIFVFACHNLIELVGYLQFLNGEPIDTIFRLYYVATVYLVLYVLLHGLSLSGLYNLYTSSASVVVASALSAALLFSDAIVAGQYPIDYSVTAVKGPYYWLFASYLITALSINIAVLLYAYKSTGTKPNLEATRCLYSLFALAPVMFVALLTVLLKVAEININAAGLGPIATAIFLVFVLKGESQHKLSDIRRFLPYSPERKVSANLINLIDDYVYAEDKTGAYKKLQAGVEREVIFYTLEKCDHNITKASDMMGLKNRSSLYSMLNRLDIDLQQLKAKPKS